MQNAVLMNTKIDNIIGIRKKVFEVTTEEKLKEYILTKYGTLQEFVEAVNLPYTTVKGIITRGILNSNSNNVFKICKTLNISADELGKGNIVELAQKDPEEPFDIERELRLYKYSIGLHSIAIVDDKPLTEEEKQMLTDGLELLLGQIKKKRERIK